MTIGRRVAWVMGSSPAAAIPALPGALGLVRREVYLAAHHLLLQNDD